MFGIFKKSKIVRKSDELNNTQTKWFNGQKVKIKSGSTSVKSSLVLRSIKRKILPGSVSNPYQFQMSTKSKCL